MKTIKIVSSIFFLAFVFILPAQAQQAQSQTDKKDKTEKIVLTSLDDFAAYEEDVKKGVIKPMDKAELAKQYSRLIEQMDQEFHNPKTVKVKSKVATPESYSMAVAPIAQPDNIDEKP